MGYFVSVGDSVARGVGDESHGGWASRLAELLAPSFGPLELVNLAERDARAPRVRITQLPAAVQRPAALAAVIVGMNDALGAFSQASFRRDYGEILAGLSGTAAHVLTTMLADVSDRLGLEESRRDRIREHIRQANEVISEVSAQHGALCLRAPEEHADSDRMWSSDGVHPGPDGHAWIAGGFAELLGQRCAPERVCAAPVGPRWFEDLARDPREEAIAPALAPDVELRTPALADPFVGRKAVAHVLAAFLGRVVDELVHETCYTRPDSFCMTFSGSVSGVPCEGIDLMETGPDGLVRNCAVFLRPLPAVAAMSRRMGEVLDADLLRDPAVPAN